MTVQSQVQALMRFAVSEHGGLDLLVNNAGGQFPSPAAGISSKGWNAVVETNLTGTFLCCREAFDAVEIAIDGAVVLETTKNAAGVRGWCSLA